MSGGNVVCPCQDCARSIGQCVERIQVAFSFKLQGTQAAGTRNEGSFHCSVTPVFRWKGLFQELWAAFGLLRF